MFRLIGQIEHVVQHEIGGSFVSEYEEETVALFTRELDALNYISAARLKHRKRSTYGGDVAYHSRSLLGSCCDAWVEGDDHSELEVDPTF